MHSISNHIETLRKRVAVAARNAARQPDQVRLIAASKTRDADIVRQTASLGVHEFGENYVSEALPKIEALTDLNLTWHFIGAIQSNKTRDIAHNFQWVQTIDRVRIAQRLSAQRPLDAGPLNALIQVNIDNEPQKAGIAATALAEFIARVLPLPGIRFRGLMAIPQPVDDPLQRRAAFRRMHELFLEVRPTAGAHWDTLSMGMSDDFETAIAEGATMIRIGTGIFGPREARRND